MAVIVSMSVVCATVVAFQRGIVIVMAMSTQAVVADSRGLILAVCAVVTMPVLIVPVNPTAMLLLIVTVIVWMCCSGLAMVIAMMVPGVQIWTASILTTMVGTAPCAETVFARVR
jgi:hypothetical protein